MTSKYISAIFTTERCIKNTTNKQYDKMTFQFLTAEVSTERNICLHHEERRRPGGY